MTYESSKGALWTVLAVATMLRLLGPIGHGLDHAEIATLVTYGRMPLSELLFISPSVDESPLYRLLAWSSLHGLGESAFALRLPALIFGVVSVGVMFRFAFRVTERREAWLATVLLVVSYHHVWFSQVARGDTALMALTLLATHYFVASLEEDGYRASIGQGLSLGLASYAHLSASLVACSMVAAAVVYRVVERGSTRRMMQALAGVLLGLVVSMALHAHSFRGVGDVSMAGVGAPPALSFFTDLVRSAFGLLVAVLIATAAALALAVGFASYLRERPSLLLLFVLPVVFSCGSMWLLGPGLWRRALFIQAGFLLLLVARGLSVAARSLSGRARMGRRAAVERGLWSAQALAAMACTLAVLPQAYALPKQDFEGALAFVLQQRAVGEMVITVGDAQLPYGRYFHTDFVPAQTLTELRVHHRPGGVLVVGAGRSGLVAGQPKLARYLQRHGTEQARFRSSVADGDVIVLRVDESPRAPARQQRSP